MPCFLLKSRFRDLKDTLANFQARTGVVSFGKNDDIASSLIKVH